MGDSTANQETRCFCLAAVTGPFSPLHNVRRGKTLEAPLAICAMDSGSFPQSAQVQPGRASQKLAKPVVSVLFGSILTCLRRQCRYGVHLCCELGQLILPGAQKTIVNTSSLTRLHHQTATEYYITHWLGHLQDSIDRQTPAKYVMQRTMLFIIRLRKGRNWHRTAPTD